MSWEFTNPRQDQVARARVGAPPHRTKEIAMSALPPKADMCSAVADVCFGPKADIPTLFDHLVGACLHCRRHVEAERLGRLQIDVELDFGGLLDWQVGGFFALENPTDVIARDAVCLSIPARSWEKWLSPVALPPDRPSARCSRADRCELPAVDLACPKIGPLHGRILLQCQASPGANDAAGFYKVAPVGDLEALTSILLDE